MKKPRQREVWSGVLALLVGLAVGRGAQEQEAVPPAPPDLSTDVLKAETSVVNLFFTVRDGQGQLVKRLGRGQFRVTDNGQPQGIRYFAEDSDQPLVLAVVVDKSASVAGEFEFEQRATSDFVRSILRAGKDQALLITFDKNPVLAVAFTDHASDFSRALLGVKAQGGTALYDSARRAIEYLGEAQAKRKVLVLVTDGEDTVSWTTHREVLALALSRNVLVYSLGVKPDSGAINPGRARRNLERLSHETGGLALFPKDDPKELAQLFDRVEEELRHEYSLGYSLPASGGKVFHEVQIEPTERSYRVHARRGYYTAPAPAYFPPAANH